MVPVRSRAEGRPDTMEWEGSFRVQTNELPGILDGLRGMCTHTWWDMSDAGVVVRAVHYTSLSAMEVRWPLVDAEGHVRTCSGVSVPRDPTTICITSDGVAALFGTLLDRASLRSQVVTMSVGADRATICTAHSDPVGTATVPGVAPDRRLSSLPGPSPATDGPLACSITVGRLDLQHGTAALSLMRCPVRVYVLRDSVFLGAVSELGVVSHNIPGIGPSHVHDTGGVPPPSYDDRRVWALGLASGVVPCDGAPSASVAVKFTRIISRFGGCGGCTVHITVVDGHAVTLSVSRSVLLHLLHIA